MTTFDTPAPPEGTGALDDRVMASITAALAAQPPDPALLARVRHRVLDAIAAADRTGHVVTPFETQKDWRRFLPGIRIKVLQESHGVMSYLLKFDPGAVLPAHRHPRGEECVVIEGEIRIGHIAVGRGG